MSTALALVNEAAERAVEQQAKTLPLPSEIEQRIAAVGSEYVAGIPTRNDHARESARRAAIDERRKAIAGYCKDRDGLLARCTKAGIEPLAVLPKAAWEHLCDAKELFLFRPENGDEVKVDPKRLLHRINRVKFWTYWSMAVLGMSVAGAFGATLANTPIIGAAGFAFIFFVLALLLPGIIMELTSKLPKKWQIDFWFDRAVTVWCLRRARLGDFVPNRGRLSESEEQKKLPDAAKPVTAHLRLPEASEEVQATLLRAKELELPLHVAAEEGAVAFAESPEELIGKERRRAEEERRYYEMLYDPIIFVEEGTAVAVVAQYGEFAVEREVVERACSTDHLL